MHKTIKLFSQHMLVRPCSQPVRHKSLNDSPHHIVIHQSWERNQPFTVHKAEDCTMIQIVVPSTAPCKMDVTYTFDLTSSANPVNHISLCAKMLLGDRGRRALIEKVDKYYLDGLKLYAEGFYDEAILKWNEAITIAASSPLKMRFEPAIQAKRAAVNFNRNKFDLESMYSVSFDDE